MKKKFSLLIFSALAVFALIMVMPSCEGPEGPQGPAGPTGPAGTDGMDGTDGVDANSFCVNCHTLDNKTTIQTQFAASVHGMTPTVARGASNDCAKCHCYQGAMETELTGLDTTAMDIDVPVKFQCDMCHDFHMSLEEDNFPDYAIRVNHAISLIGDGHMTKIDLAGSGNACATCHQTRRGTAAFGSGEEVNVNSTHWGGHHGPQGNILGGTGAYEPTGSKAYGNTAHTSMAGCSDCHMAKNAENLSVGGHSFMMADESGYENVVGCQKCHSGATDFDLGGVQTEVAGLLESLHELLYEHGLYSEEGLHDGGHPVTSGDLGRNHTEQEAGAVFNYILFEEDRSMGVHNPKYVIACLTNTIEMVESW